MICIKKIFLANFKSYILKYNFNNQKKDLYFKIE